jgi:hypothetical protein
MFIELKLTSKNVMLINVNNIISITKQGSENNEWVTIKTVDGKENYSDIPYEKISKLLLSFRMINEP